MLNGIGQLAWIHAAARVLAPSLVPPLATSAERTGAARYLEALRDDVPTWSVAEWARTADAQLLGRPFSDAGEERVIRFRALGTRWTIRSSTELSHVRAAERLAAGAEITLVELADDELCLLPTHVDVRVTAGDFSIAEPDPRQPWWRVSLTAYDPTAPEQIDELFGELVTTIVAFMRGASLADDDTFDVALDRAVRNGLLHKLATGRLYDDLAEVVAAERYAESLRDSAEPAVDKLGGEVTESAELGWRDGAGPTYDRDRSLDMIRRRYDVLPRLMRRSLPRLRSDAGFRRTVDALRGDGWRDWHILTAAHNVTLNTERELSGRSVNSREDRERESRRANEPDDTWADVVPLSAYHREALDQARRMAMLSSLKSWDLRLNQPLVNAPAVEEFLARRYAYWVDDVEHHDPFAEPS